MSSCLLSCLAVRDYKTAEFREQLYCAPRLLLFLLYLPVVDIDSPVHPTRTFWMCWDIPSICTSNLMSVPGYNRVPRTDQATSLNYLLGTVPESFEHERKEPINAID
jgi:hypothetical protein